MPNLTVAYLLGALSFFGVAGLNRFYLGKPVTGVLWFLTGGMFMIGAIYDMITMERQVAEAAARRGLAPAPAPIAPPRPALPPNPVIDLELRVLRLAEHHQGRLTTPIVASQLGIPLADAERKLDGLAANGHAEIDVTDDGVIVYDFPALRLAS
jgi:hypothetical protein